ncbi:MAG: FecCD family ABC transporter permease [Galactobacter sp.]
MRLSPGGRVPVLVFMLLLLVPLSVASFAIGSRVIPFDVTVDAILAYDPTVDQHLTIREGRVPRTLIAILAGAALGLGGALMQSLTRNALAEPGTLGVNAGAAAGVVLGLAFTGSGSILVYVWFAFVGAALAALIVHRLGRAGESGVNPVRLVLAGAGLSVSLSSLTTMMVLSSSQQVFDSFRSWATGSLQGRGWDVLPLLAVCLVIGVITSGFLAGSLNAVSLGSDIAKGLGANIKGTWALTNFTIILLAGVATAAVGPISFVGLAAPHVARALVGPDHRWLLPYSAVISALILVIADVVGRVVIFPGEVGAGIMCALVGAPFFIMLVRRGKVEGL